MTSMLPGSSPASVPLLTVYFCYSNDLTPVSNSFRRSLFLFGSVWHFVYFPAAHGDRADCDMFKSLSPAGYNTGPPWVRIGSRMWKLKLSDIGSNMLCNMQSDISSCFLFRGAGVDSDDNLCHVSKAVHCPAFPPALLVAALDLYLAPSSVQLKKNPSRQRGYVEKRFLNCIRPSLQCDKRSKFARIFSRYFFFCGMDSCCVMLWMFWGHKSIENVYFV